METQEEAREYPPSYIAHPPPGPNLPITGKGYQDQRGERHPVGGDDECRRVAQLDKD